MFSLAASHTRVGWRVYPMFALKRGIPVIQETAATETLNPI